MKKVLITGLVILALILPASCGLVSRGPQPQPSISITVASPASNINAKSANGLEIILGLNSNTFKPGEPVMVTVGLRNTRDVINDVASANNWPVKGLGMGPCGTVNYPMGMAFFVGYYTEEDIYTATPLRLYDPKAVYHCPDILSEINSYVFQPSTSIADVYGSCESGPCLEDFEIEGTVSYTGFWPGGDDAKLSNFTPGVYTVVCGDEWGGLAVVHFLVLGDDPQGE
jgi:hypothetical protein